MCSGARASAAAARPPPATGSAGGSCACCRSRRPTRSFDRIADVTCPARRRRACTGCAPTTPGSGPSWPTPPSTPSSATGCAPTCATAARRSGSRLAARTSWSPTRPRRGRRPGARALAHGRGAVVVFLRPHRQLGLGGAWAADHLGAGHDRRRAARARGGLRRVRRLPAQRSAWTIIPLTGGDDPFRGSCGRLRGRRGSSPCSPTATSPSTASRSTSAATAPGWRKGPAVLAAADRRAAARRVDPLRARRRRGGSAAPDRHPVQRPAAAPAERHDARGAAMIQECADHPRRRDPRAHRRTGTCCSRSSSTTSTRPRPLPGRASRGRPREDRHRLPLLVRRARGGAVPRPRPRRALHRARATTCRVLAPGRRRRPTLPPYVIVGRPGGGGALQRLGRAAQLRAGDRRAGRRVARAAASSTCCTCTSRSRRASACSRCGRPRARSSRPSTPRCSGRATMQTAYPILRPSPGEDQRPHRGLRGRPAHRDDPRRRRRRRHPQRRLRRPVRATPPRGRTGVGTPARPRSPSSAGWASRARGSRCCAARAARGRCAPCPGLRVLVAGPGDADEVTAALAAGGRRGLRVPRLGLRRGQGRAAAHRSTSTSRPNTGGESFGIILIEAMAAGARVLASDLPAFSRVLDGGAAGAMFANEHADDLARTLARPARATRPAGPSSRRRASKRAGRFDWSVVAADDPGRLRDRHRGAAAAQWAAGERRWAPLPARRGQPVTRSLSWVFAVLFVLVVIAWYLSYTAARLDRLHVRLERHARGPRRPARAPGRGRRRARQQRPARRRHVAAARQRGRASRSRRPPSTARPRERPRTTSPRPSTSP